MNNSFFFNSQTNLVKLLGIKAKNPHELMKGIKSVPKYSIYYHTHRPLFQHRSLSPEPPNDFAYWLTNIINLKELGEKIASVNIIGLNNIEELRENYLKIFSEYINEKRYVVDAPEGYEFHFMSCSTFIFPTRRFANNLKEFIEIIKDIGISSLYYHIYEARTRLSEGENDFTAWFRGIGEKKLADELCKVDPYNMTLESLRDKILKMAGKYA
jgi:hypothetical protein